MTAPQQRLADQASGAPLRPHRWKVFAASWALFSLLSVLWALATPVSASPDEPAHIVKAASVAQGQFIGEPSSLGHVVHVPRYIASTHAETCFAFVPTEAADCAHPLAGDPAELVDSTTTAGLYNPVYYLLVGWPSLIFDDATGIYVMRAVSAVLSSLFLAFAAMIAFSWRRNTLPLIALGVAATPMLLFLGGSVNPNAVETSATLAVFAAMLATVTQADSRLLSERAAIVAVSAAIAVNTRGLSPLWVAVAILAPLVLLTWSQIWSLLKARAVQCAVGVAAASTLFAMVWLLQSNSLTAALEVEDNFQTFPGVGTSAPAGFLMTLRDTFGYGQGMVGNFGWLDTPAPIGVYFLWAVFTGGLALAAFSMLRGRSLLLATIVTAAFILLPAAIQGAYITGGGLIWQGRYNLPLFALFCFGLAAMIANQLEHVNHPVMTRLSFIVWASWGIGQIAAFATALKRYAVGSDGSWKNMLFAPEWNAPGSNLLWLVSFAVVTLVFCWLAWRASCWAQIHTDVALGSSPQRQFENARA